MFKDLTETWKGFTKEKIKPLTLILVVVNVVCLLISNIIAAKTFPIINTNAFTIVMPCAVILFPIVITVSDMLGEVDYIWTRRSCHIGFLMNLLMVAAFEIAIIMPGETDLSVLHSTSFLLIASLISFYFGDLINDTIFLKLKNKDGVGNKLVKRCIISTLFGQLVDSSIYMTFGMHILPKLFLGFEFMSWAQVGCAILVQVTIKVLYEFLLSPIIIKLCKSATTTEE